MARPVSDPMPTSPVEETATATPPSSPDVRGRWISAAACSHVRARVRPELAWSDVCALSYRYGAGRHHSVERSALGRDRAADRTLDRRTVRVASGRNCFAPRKLSDGGRLSEHLC